MKRAGNSRSPQASTVRFSLARERSRVFAASIAELDAMAERLLTLHTLVEVLAATSIDRQMRSVHR
jgi:hypothetical protein